MRKWVGFIAVVLMLVVMAGCASADKVSAANDARNGVVRLYEYTNTYDSNGQLINSMPVLVDGQLQYDRLSSVSAGTAFFVGDSDEVEYLVTCAHCVENYYKYGRGKMVSIDVLGYYQELGKNVYYTLNRQVTLRVAFDQNTALEAYLVDYDETKDIAVLRLEKPTKLRKYLKLRVPKDSKVTEDVYALGYPYLADYKPTTNYNDLSSMTSTKGGITRLVTESDTGVKLVNYDATITQGNSGGPLVDTAGNAVGVVSEFYTGRFNEQSYYAVNVAEVIDMLKRNQVPHIVATDFPVLLVVILGVVIVVLVVLIVVLVVKKGGKVGKSGKGSSDRYLVCETGALAGQSFPLKRGQRVTIGRSSDCQIRFPSNTAGVSKLHCSVVYDGEKVLIRDENSTAGTFIDGNKLTPGTAVTLHRGHPVGLGSKAQILVLRSKK